MQKNNKLDQIKLAAIGFEFEKYKNLLAKLFANNNNMIE